MPFSTYLFFDGRCEEVAAFYQQAIGTMPLTNTFFAPKFGMLTDRFGMSWRVLVGDEA